MFSSSALESMEGQSQPAGSPLEELPQQINGISLEKVQQYYRKLRYFMLLLFLKRHWKEHSLLRTLKFNEKEIPFLMVSCTNMGFGDPYCVGNLLIFFP